MVTRYKNSTKTQVELRKMTNVRPCTEVSATLGALASGPSEDSEDGIPAHIRATAHRFPAQANASDENELEAGPYTSPLSQLNLSSCVPVTTQLIPLIHSETLKIS